MGLKRRCGVALVGLALIASLAGCRGGGTPWPTTSTTNSGGGGTPWPTTSTTTNSGGGGGGRNPVVFVHGFGSSATQWTGVIRQFRSRGYASNVSLTAISYNSSVGIEVSARTLETEVNRVIRVTGSTKVDIVSHSMGSMVAKTCIIIGGCKGKVAHWNTISGVDNGTANEIIIARGTRSNEDVQGRTPLRKQLQDSWQDGIVAQGVKVQVHWSRNDGIVVPGNLSMEPPPAINIEKSSLNHMSIYSNATVISEIVAFFAT
jgi:triacylglycerol lipase